MSRRAGAEPDARGGSPGRRDGGGDVLAGEDHARRYMRRRSCAPPAESRTSRHGARDGGRGQRRTLGKAVSSGRHRGGSRRRRPPHPRGSIMRAPTPPIGPTMLADVERDGYGPSDGEVDRTRAAPHAAAPMRPTCRRLAMRRRQPLRRRSHARRSPPSPPPRRASRRGRRFLHSAVCRAGRKLLLRLTSSAATHGCSAHSPTLRLEPGPPLPASPQPPPGLPALIALPGAFPPARPSTGAPSHAPPSSCHCAHRERERWEEVKRREKKGL